MKKRPGKYSILNKKNSIHGRISAVIACVAIAVFIAAVVIAIVNRGNAGIIVGILGVLTFVIAMIGFVIGMLGFKDQEHNEEYCWIGSIANACIWLGIIGIFLAFV